MFLRVSWSFKGDAFENGSACFVNWLRMTSLCLTDGFSTLWELKLLLHNLARMFFWSPFQRAEKSHFPANFKSPWCTSLFGRIQSIHRGNISSSGWSAGGFVLALFESLRSMQVQLPPPPPAPVLPRSRAVPTVVSSQQDLARQLLERTRALRATHYEVDSTQMKEWTCPVCESSFKVLQSLPDDPEQLNRAKLGPEHNHPVLDEN